MSEKKKIVVVDDELDIIQIIKAVLQTKGYEVYTATDGETGLRLIKKIGPDLIILDLMMPKVSGLEACKILKNDPKFKETPIIVISAIGKKSGKSEDFWKTGLKADDFVSKPFDPLNLLGRVEYLLRRDDYVSQKNEVKQPAHPKITDLAKLPPRVIVKVFVQSWNTKDFENEYKCLATSMTNGLSMQSYVGRRTQFYLDEHGETQQQRVLKIVSCEEDGNNATIVCVREDMKNNFSRLEKQKYNLRLTPEGWKIFSVQNLK